MRSLLLLFLGGSVHGQDFDVLIRGGRLLDGTGTPWVHADIGISGERIVAVGKLSATRARQVIDATGLFVAPGFIDGHTHAGPALGCRDFRPRRRAGPCYL